MSDNTDFDLNAFSKELWGERITASEPVLDALITDHQTQMNALIAPMMDASTDTLMESLSGMLATGDCDWYVEPAKKTCASVDRLSKGFAMASSQISRFFDDIYVGRDIRDVLLNTEQAPSVYPNTIGMASGYFLNTVSQYLPEDFWDRTKELEDTKLSLSFVGDFAANEQTMAQTTALMCLFEAQRMSRVMPLVAGELKSLGYANLATIADCFAGKGNTMSKDIVAKVGRAISTGQNLNIIAGCSNSPRAGITPS